MQLNTPIDNLPNTRSDTIRKLKSIGINTYWNLLNYFPFRYENYSLISPINRVQLGEVVTVQGTLEELKNIYLRNGRKIQKGVVTDPSGKIEVVWFNQPYLTRILSYGMQVSLSGEVKYFGKSVSFEPKEYEVLKSPSSNPIHTGRLVPVYPEKNGLSTRLLREKISLVFSQIEKELIYFGDMDILPSEIILFNHLMSEYDSYRHIHFPKDYLSAKKARERLGFDELFIIQLSSSLVKKEWQKERVGNVFTAAKFKKNVQEFMEKLPFTLTGAQKRVVDEILTDLAKPVPMNRFLEGDVGSGKTVVAAIASYLSHLNSFQTLFMAPTEILALQHYRTISQLFKDLPLKIAIQTGTNKITSNSSAKKSKTIDDYDIVIGTHALIQKKINFAKVGLVIIDEQHRFGVRQRSLLKEKGMNPHLLTMTATPIPRTVALTLYGELDLSLIDEMPKGRLPIKTFLVPKEKRESGYEWIKKQIQTHGVQVFVICPLIEESEVETMKSAKAATKEFERLKKEVFPELKLALLHGKLKSKEKETIMNDFKDKKYDILVATSVVEVGIDIPNATIMIIEAADRFGMAQLHQLRGRVGRGAKQSYCLLYSESQNEETIKRLNLFAKTNNGIKIAEYDFQMRGPGDIYGTRQHGHINLKIAMLSDLKLIESSRKAVDFFLNTYKLEDFPVINSRMKEYQAKQISRD